VTATSAGTAPPIAQPRRAWVQQVMGMPVSIHLRGTGCFGEAAESQVAQVYRELRAVDAVFSTYRPRSQVSMLADGAITAADAGAVVREVIGLCAEAAERTDGCFRAWLPRVDEGPGDVTTAPSRLDPSGLVKGWAAERAAGRLARLGVDHYLNAGGDIALRSSSGRPWRVGVEDPREPRRVVAVVEATSGGIATSGTAHRGGHVLDPRTGRPADPYLLSVTVCGPSLMWADVYATAALVMGRSALEWVEQLSGYDALVVPRDDGVRTTSGWPGGPS
jgi:FAD:protein FMN transferase